MSAEGAAASPRSLSARQVTRQRRKASAGRTWQEFKRHRTGLAGLVVLVLFALIAIFAPLIADSDGLSKTQASGGGAKRAR